MKPEVQLLVDPTSNMAYITVGTEDRAGIVKRTVSAADGRLNLDFDREGRLVGIEIFDAAASLPKSCVPTIG